MTRGTIPKKQKANQFFFLFLHILKLEVKAETWCETNVSLSLTFYVKKPSTWVWGKRRGGEEVTFSIRHP